MKNDPRRRRERSVRLLAMLAVAIAACVWITGAATTSPSHRESYIVVMTGDPAVVYDGGIAGIPATKPAEGKKFNPRSAAARQYRGHLEREHNASLAAVGLSAGDKINEYTVSLNGYSALLTKAQAAALENRKDVLRVIKDELRQPQTDASPGFLGLTGPGGAYASGFTGNGVVVGVIDTGIWPEHPSFADDGSYPAPPTDPLPCQFGVDVYDDLDDGTPEPVNPDDAPFTCNNKLIGAREMLETYRTVLGADPDEYDSARDDEGHGTHTASTAAGNAGVSATLLGIPRGKVSGIAPRAHVVAYKALGNQGGFTSDLVASIDQAVEDGVDVVNYSIGGGASLTSGDDISFLFAADAGLFVAASAGNDGPGPGTVGGPATVPWLTAVGASTQSRFFQGTVVLGNGKSYTGASITDGVGTSPLVDGAALGNELCDPDVKFKGSISGKIVLCLRGEVDRIAKSRAVLEQGGVGMVHYEPDDEGNLFTDSHFVPSVHVDNTPGLAIKSYIGSVRKPTARIVAKQVSTWPFAPSMTDFSSRGPDTVAEDIIKPDVTAPGIQILAGNSPTPDPGLPAGELFQAIAGTSMSSPHVAGLFALLKQAHPDWSAAEAKSALMTTARQDVLNNDRKSKAGPFDMGAGHVNPGRPGAKGSSFQPGLVYDAGFNEYLGFLCDADRSVFANPDATCTSLENAGVPVKATDLNLPSIGVSQVAGTATVTRTATSVTKETSNVKFSANVSAPAGYSISVSPSTLTLKSGQSASFEVTISNVSAPIGEWRTGSLTWTDSRGNYSVRSPIALKATQFSAPDELEGTGESGSLDFQVQFGYTGDYAAQAHGLVPATLTDANVKQDPDQTFDPSDTAAGGANAHTFDLSNVGVFRIAIPPDAVDDEEADLDVYVYNPDGEQVATSTLGGTDEEVTIQDPADGTWTVYVHGWQAPGGDTNYTLYSWEVSNDPGGNLSIDSAPTSATSGEVATIGVSWTGATAGQWHLGAVSHNQGSTVFGRTLIDVDNR
jgi:subtilisin family serine protease